jgi:tetratricopeptide (TPR) repeat protein
MRMELVHSLAQLCLLAVSLALAAVPAQSPGEEARRAQELVTLGKLDEAIGVYQGLLRASPGNATLLVNLAIAEYKAGRWADCATHSEAALRLQPDLLTARLFLGAARIELEDFAAAIEPLERVVAANPGERNGRLMLGEALAGLQRYEEALPHLKSAMQLLPANPRAWYSLGSALEAADRKDEAREVWARLAALPESAEFHQHAAHVHEAAGRWLDAAAEWRRALVLAPASRAARLGLAGSLFRTRDYEAAMAAVEPLLGEGGPVEARFLYGASLLNLQKPEEAIPHLRAAQSYAPARVALGQALLLTGRPAEAVPLLKEGLPGDTDGTVHFQLFRAYQQLGRYEEAREALKAYRRLRSSP